MDEGSQFRRDWRPSRPGYGRDMYKKKDIGLLLQSQGQGEFQSEERLWRRTQINHVVSKTFDMAGHGRTECSDVCPRDRKPLGDQLRQNATLIDDMLEDRCVGHDIVVLNHLVVLYWLCSASEHPEKCHCFQRVMWPHLSCQHYLYDTTPLPMDGALLFEGERLMAPRLRSPNGTTRMNHATEASHSDVGYESAHGVVRWRHPSMVLLHNAVHAASSSTHGGALHECPSTLGWCACGRPSNVTGG
jgi:hypothetical protein